MSSSFYNHSSTSESDDDDELNELISQVSPVERLVQEVQEQRRLLNHEMVNASSNTLEKRKYINRDREGAHTRLMNDYFIENLTYGSNIFRRRFRMSKDLFIRIVGALEFRDPYFQSRVDVVGRKSFSPLQKCTVAIRQLAYGGPADHYDEYLRVAETTAIKCLFKFCRCVIDVFGPHYLRTPTAADVQRLYQMHEQRHGFPGMLGSLDCMHWQWKNCPVAWKGQYTRGDHGVPTIMLEAVASQDLWIWHAYFGVAGSNNDINVLNQSPLFNEVVQGRAPNMNFVINGRQYKQGYYLTDGIYPEWATFVKSFQCPHDPKKNKFKEMQEAARKDVQRAFGVLQARWAIIRGPGHFWYKSNLKEIMIACIILHNMIVEHEGDSTTDWTGDPNMNNNINNVNNPSIIQGSVEAFNRYLHARSELRDQRKHHQLQKDLVEPYGHVMEKINQIILIYEASS